MIVHSHRLPSPSIPMQTDRHSSPDRTLTPKLVDGLRHRWQAACITAKRLGALPDHLLPLNGDQRAEYVTLPIDRLITYDKLDIVARMEFLRACEAGTLKEPSKTLYYSFIGDKGRGSQRDASCMVVRFLSLYLSICHRGYRPDLASNPISVVYCGAPHKSYLPPSATVATMLVDEPWELMDGSHRIAILKRLGYRKVRCRIHIPTARDLPWSAGGWRASDFTSYILSTEYGREWLRRSAGDSEIARWVEAALRHKIGAG